MHLRAFLLGLACLLPLPSAAQDLAEVGLAARIESLGSAPSFERGMLETLRGVERALQARYDYGLSLGRMSAPILRLDMRQMPNPAPRDATPGTAAEVIRAFVADMRRAQSTLASQDPEEIAPFDLSLADIWFDINSDGQRAPAEDAVRMLGPVVLGPGNWARFSRAEAAETPLAIRFDAADHAWLLAYTHMLSGLGNLALAFDPTPVIADLAEGRSRLRNAPTIPNVYDEASLRQDLDRITQDLEALRVRNEAFQKEIDPIYEQIEERRKARDEAITENDQERVNAELRALRDRIDTLRKAQRDLNLERAALMAERRALQAKLPESPGTLQGVIEAERATIDLVYVLLASLEQTPDAAFMKAAHDDWLTMIAQNRIFWDRLSAETDDLREWIPNPNQTAALPIEIPAGAAAGWQAILDDAEAVLRGDLLIPHPLLPQGHGIRVPDYVAAPSALNLLSWIHGRAAWDYAARGPLMTTQSLRAFQRLTGGNAGGFALFFN